LAAVVGVAALLTDVVVAGVAVELPGCGAIPPATRTTAAASPAAAVVKPIVQRSAARSVPGKVVVVVVLGMVRLLVVQRPDAADATNLAALPERTPRLTRCRR
jgi:hypothetical protein